MILSICLGLSLNAELNLDEVDRILTYMHMLSDGIGVWNQ
jgi:hypothetical protein